MISDQHNDARYKLSPFKTLSSEQLQLKNKVMAFIHTHLGQSQHAVFTIYGEAGTGKSVVLSQIFNKLQTAARSNPQSALYGTKNVFLVNHPEILKVYQEIAGEQPHLFKKDFDRPTSFINRRHKDQKIADITVIDEAHLLLSRPDRYNNFDQQNQLVEIIKHSKIVILVFDENQVLKTKSYWDHERLAKIVNPYDHDSYILQDQFRMHADPRLIAWIDDLTHGNLDPLPKHRQDHFDFRILDDAQKMYQLIQAKNQAVGLSRIVSTTGYPSKLDGGKHYIVEGNFKLPWDQYNYSRQSWAEKPETIHEVGSIYTVQGFDLNYVGVILGPPIEYDPLTEGVTVNLSKVTDSEIFKKRADLTDQKELIKIKQRLIMNTLNVLLKRGVHGLYIYASQPELRQKLANLYVDSL
ncbi:hypothetical protein IV80_GL000431 [Pediococcus cellicola]|uniref:Schlafen group 3-like DNA/RNA helicase domain-containing protein n=1 Tax=Pediococcus cellicola TaxID=319652 RepID=A0A0R2IPB4_9LACO|nr:DUF2075 domain-containing protein [Pediococcus cellicola]KRN65222.1 hypothetical protein IV80_GL000431 [Pediococcus cellicola]GEL15397.1 hypothetical protein PCE01_11990 [Pediococcus cellicola]